MSWTLMLLMLLTAATEASAVVVHLSDYFFPVPLSRTCRYYYATPEGHPDFTVKVTKLTGGLYAGHYRMGDYNIPDGEEAVWRIFDFDYSSWIQYYLLYADSNIGDLPEPARIRGSYDADTPYVSPLSSTNTWFFRITTVGVGEKIYQNVLLWAVFDSKAPATSLNTKYGLPTNYGMLSTFSLHAKGIGELVHLNADSGGNIRYQFILKSTGVPGATAGVALLLN
jgi:hypothetical protein